MANTETQRLDVINKAIDALNDFKNDIDADIWATIPFSDREQALRNRRADIWHALNALRDAQEEAQLAVRSTDEYQSGLLNTMKA